MDYKIEELKVKNLVDLIDQKKVDLNPSYQRNFIWSPNDQSELIDTVINGFPLPSFFMFERTDGTFEMVDGQQRSKSIYRYSKGVIKSSKKTGELTSVENDISDYILPFIIISNLKQGEYLKDFYVLINKKGKHLNVPEVHKSEFHDTKFLKLANELLTYQNFMELNLFTEASSKRMNDRAFLEELISYLKLGIKEKKKHISKIFEEDIDESEYEELKDEFCKVIDIISVFNEIHPIRSTRYKQKNDFYTLFTFIHLNRSLNLEVLKYQYFVLLTIDGKDEDGNQFVRPTNDECEALKEYARNCVTQSNSRKAREERLEFFESILKNQDSENPNDVLLDVLRYLGDIYGEDKIELLKIGDFSLLDVDKLN